MSCFDNCGCNRQRRSCSCGCDFYTYRPYSVGQRGPAGPQGPVGPQGPQGLPGGLLNYADFYALMPTDNATAIAAGADIAFPQTAVASAGITRLSPTSFSLTTGGVYKVTFDAATTEAGQLVLTLNGTEIPYTVAGSTAAGSEIGKSVLITAPANSVLTVRNPAAATTALTLTPSAGGTAPVSAHLVIEQIA